MEDRGAIDSKLNFEANAANQNFAESLIYCFNSVRKGRQSLQSCYLRKTNLSVQDVVHEM